MALSIKSEEADRLARRLAEATGETLTQAILVALRERLDRELHGAGIGIAERLGRLAEDALALPIVDARPADELVGYDELGLPA